MKQLNYTKAVVIVHGKSEKQICQYIKNKLRLKIEIYSDKNGEKAIQITSLKNTLNNKIFKSFRNFIKVYEDIKLTDDRKFIDDKFKIFPTDPKYENTDEIQIKQLLHTLKKQKNTNLNEFLDFCLKSSD